jgi:hypothetical protein
MDTVLHRQEIAKVVESVGKSLIPSTRGCDAINLNNLQWGVISDPDTLRSAAYLSGKQGIFLNLNKGESGISINIYELQSTFRHELLHFVDAKRWDNYSENSSFSYRNHANIYLEQMKYPEFLKTSVDYQLNVIKSYYLQIWNEYMQRGRNKFLFYVAVERFNEGIGKEIDAKILPDGKEDFNKKKTPTDKVTIIIKGKNEPQTVDLYILPHPID